MINIVIENKIIEKKRDVINKLNSISTILNNNGKLYFIKRKDIEKRHDNLKVELSITDEDIKKILINLNVHDYAYSIYETKNNLGYLMVFLIELKKRIIYIKIIENKNKIIICYSFHESINKVEYYNKPYLKRGK